MKLFTMKRSIVRARTRDIMTFDHINPMGMIDALGTMRGKAFDHAFKTHDGARTVDSTGAFLVGELERLDQTLHMPLAAVTWARNWLMLAPPPHRFP